MISLIFQSRLTSYGLEFIHVRGKYADVVMKDPDAALTVIEEFNHMDDVQISFATSDEVEIYVISFLLNIITLTFTYGVMFCVPDGIEIAFLKRAMDGRSHTPYLSTLYIYHAGGTIATTLCCRDKHPLPRRTPIRRCNYFFNILSSGLKYFYQFRFVNVMGKKIEIFKRLKARKTYFLKS